ncbi:MAG TPA: tRNA dimethylallyltransferase, partial [Casimicrobiaceae bacterium]|nr:tRNA dimethylallyltransferase [Casimicrobiaceae bacterium]
DAMLDAGLIDEVLGLRARFALRPDMPSMRAVGYRQAFAYLDGRINRAELRERGIAATRQLAKRQITWLRAMNVETIDCFGAGVDANVTTLVARAIGRDEGAASVSR